MKSNLSIVFLKLLKSFNLLFPRSSKKVGNAKSYEADNLYDAPPKCYRCGGTGFIKSRGGVEEYIPSRFGSLCTTPISTCPLCQGTGYIKSLRVKTKNTNVTNIGVDFSLGLSQVMRPHLPPDAEGDKIYITNISGTRFLKNILRFHRNRLDKMIHTLKGDDPIPAIFLWDLLFEIYATLKTTVLQTEPPAKFPKLENLFNGRSHNLTFISGFQTFTGCLLKVQEDSGMTIALKIAAKHRVMCIRDYAKATIALIESYDIENDIKSFLIWGLFYLINNELDILKEELHLEILYKSLHTLSYVIIPTPLKNGLPKA